VLVWILVPVIAVEAAAIGWLTVAWLRARRDVAAARHELAAASRQSPRSPAGLAMKAVAQTAARVREQGVLGGLLTSSFEDLSRWISDQRSDIARVAAPDGTVAIFFSDIEDSTALNERLGDERWVRVLSAHNALVRRAVGRCGGQVVKSQGDGFMVVFGDPAGAAQAAVDVQHGLSGRRPVALRRTPVRVRIGLHVGATVSREGDYFGRNVALAARVAAQAAGLQILASDDFRSALADNERFRFEPYGEVEFKGLADRHVLWELRY
jgi:adenylate cyclase